MKKEDLSNWTPRPAPKPVRLEGRYVTLVPYVRDEHALALWAALGEIGVNARLKYFAAPDFQTADVFADWLDAVEKAGWLREVFIDNNTGDVVGMAHYMRADPANGVVEVGGVAHGLAMARSPISTEAHFLMARHVFEDLGYRRYEWKCHNDNAPSHAAAKRLGFSFEGVFRKHMISRGENRDTAWYAMIDDDWPRLKMAFEAWLAPANFDAEGRQLRGLSDIRTTITEG
ncbi:RimJ/RimL family protein N-acetyltransferase [Rhizobium sp. SG_E_25_P2]|uniref:GNAT family N-acetyltransferase n=1 Tax=Rhizobium sp. SG_E_25_P2 TaxID=2879942 RepID=UPI002475AE72|nr:GNAT family protein [Rhizobium sp. SG_E_25_P2]MDH6269748.1 RimJ/RimL family protein N-acetyltransferase [Rhizobium sp. SG_E_25_P2]